MHKSNLIQNFYSDMKLKKKSMMWFNLRVEQQKFFYVQPYK